MPSSSSGDMPAMTAGIFPRPVRRTPMPDTILEIDGVRVLCQVHRVHLDDLERDNAERGTRPMREQPASLARTWPPAVVYETILRRETG